MINRLPCHVFRQTFKQVQTQLRWSHFWVVWRCSSSLIGTFDPRWYFDTLTSSASSHIAGYVAALGSSPQTMRTFCKQFLGAMAIFFLPLPSHPSWQSKLATGFRVMSEIPLDLLKHIISILLIRTRLIDHKLCTKGCGKHAFAVIGWCLVQLLTGTSYQSLPRHSKTSGFSSSMTPMPTEF